MKLPIPQILCFFGFHKWDWIRSKDYKDKTQWKRCERCRVVKPV